MPLVSILIANLNNGQYIRQTLESAIGQTYHDIEIIVVDDGSTDDSVQVIQQFIDSHKKIPIYFHRNDAPAGCGRIKRQLIELSHGDYFIFLDPEDTFTPNAVAILLAEHERSTYSIVYGTHYLCDEQLHVQGISDYPGAIPDGLSHLTSTAGHISAPALCRRSCYNCTEGINPTFYVAEDQDLYLKLEEVAPVLYVDRPLYYYRHHDHNTSWNDEKTFSNYYWRYHCMKAAYIRRKRNKSAIDNLSSCEISNMMYSYYVRLSKHHLKAFREVFLHHTCL